MATHKRGVTNPMISLCQEYEMRTGGYDDLARVWVAGQSVRFAEVVERLGLDEAIRNVQICGWMTLPELLSREVLYGHDPCTECEEVTHA